MAALRRYFIFLGFALIIVTGSASVLPLIASYSSASNGMQPGGSAGKVQPAEPEVDHGWSVASVTPESRG
ncbi:hypothetical protein [Streptomyces werraensis]|uniref:hypothetical protein n=1 Tax=Streptomyces werraensis TaxID=68284 RepID=UPI001CE2797E